MSNSRTKPHLQTDWARVDALTDETIDTSDIAPLGDAFFERAKLRMPPNPVTVEVMVDQSVLEWFRDQGADYENRMSAALRLYAEAHRAEMH